MVKVLRDVAFCGGCIAGMRVVERMGVGRASPEILPILRVWPVVEESSCGVRRQSLLAGRILFHHLGTFWERWYHDVDDLRIPQVLHEVRSVGRGLTGRASWRSPIEDFSTFTVFGLV